MMAWSPAYARKSVKARRLWRSSRDGQSQPAPITPFEDIALTDLLALAARLGQRVQAAAYLVDAPFEEGAQQLLLFEGHM